MIPLNGVDSDRGQALLHAEVLNADHAIERDATIENRKARGSSPGLVQPLIAFRPG